MNEFGRRHDGQGGALVPVSGITPAAGLVPAGERPRWERAVVPASGQEHGFATRVKNRREVPSETGSLYEATNRARVVKIYGNDATETAEAAEKVVVTELLGRGEHAVSVLDLTRQPHQSDTTVQQAHRRGIIHRDGPISAQYFVASERDPQDAAELVVESTMGAIDNTPESDQRRRRVGLLRDVFFVLGSNNLIQLRDGLRELHNPAPPSDSRRRQQEQGGLEIRDSLTDEQRDRLKKALGKNLPDPRKQEYGELRELVDSLLYEDMAYAPWNTVPDNAPDPKGDWRLETYSHEATTRDVTMLTRLSLAKWKKTLARMDPEQATGTVFVIVGADQVDKETLTAFEHSVGVRGGRIIEVHQRVHEDPRLVHEIGGEGVYTVVLGLTERQQKAFAGQWNQTIGVDQARGQAVGLMDRVGPTDLRRTRRRTFIGYTPGGVRQTGPLDPDRDSLGGREYLFGHLTGSKPALPGQKVPGGEVPVERGGYKVPAITAGGEEVLPSGSAPQEVQQPVQHGIPGANADTHFGADQAEPEESVQPLGGRRLRRRRARVYNALGSLGTGQQENQEPDEPTEAEIVEE